MKLSKKLIASVILSTLVLGTSVSAKPIDIKKHKMMSPSAEMESLMNDSVSSAKSLVIMGNKIVTDGNSTGEPEKMLAGAKMMMEGLKMVSHHLSHQVMMHKPIKGMLLSKESIISMKKMSDDSAMSIMRMGNKMVRDGNAKNDSQKMMAGANMLDVAMNLHHTGMMDQDMSGWHHK